MLIGAPVSDRAGTLGRRAPDSHLLGQDGHAHSEQDDGCARFAGRVSLFDCGRRCQADEPARGGSDGHRGRPGPQLVRVRGQGRPRPDGVCAAESPLCARVVGERAGGRTRDGGCLGGDGATCNRRRLFADICGLQDRASAAQLYQAAQGRLHGHPHGAMGVHASGAGRGRKTAPDVRMRMRSRPGPIERGFRRSKWSTSSRSARSASACPPSCFIVTATSACTPRARPRSSSTTAPFTWRYAVLRLPSWIAEGGRGLRHPGAHADATKYVRVGTSPEIG